jgi:hypothetical protein
MNGNETIEHLFSPTPAGREAARRTIGERLEAAEREQRTLGQIRAHLDGNTAIGEALSYFYGQHELEPGLQTHSNQRTAEQVIGDFLENPNRYRDAWREGSLCQLVAEEVRFRGLPLYREPADYVWVRLADAMDAQFTAQYGTA